MTKYKKCCICKEEKDVYSFNKRKASKDGLQKHCRNCNKIYAKKYYKNNKKEHKKKVYIRKKININKNKKQLMDFLVENPCVDCGYSNILALDFDHVRGKKILEVTTLLRNGYSWENIKKEIDKCEVRCRNCHSIKTHIEQHSYRVEFIK